MALPRGFSFCSVLLLTGLVTPSLAFGQTPPVLGDSSSTVSATGDIRPLEQGNPIERQLAGGESHSYQVTVRSGQYLHVIIEQIGIAVKMTLFAPDGKPLARSYSPNGKQGSEPISLIASASGKYRLDVLPAQSEAPRGRYSVRVDGLRTAAASDKMRVAAERAFMEGQRLRFQGTAVSRQQAIKEYSQALALFRSLGDRYWESNTLNASGVIYWSLGENQKALDYYNQALPLRRLAGDRFAEANTLNNLGAVYWALGERLKAREYYNQALPLRRMLGDKEGEALSLNNIGLTYWALDELQEALNYYNQALPLAQSLGDKDVQAETLNSIGLVYWSLGEWQKALEYYDKALPLAQELSDKDGQANTLNGIGVVYWSKGEPQKALNYYNRALPLLQEAGDRSGEATTLSNIGNAYFDSGDKLKALDYYNRALLLAQQVRNSAQEASTLSKIGRVYSDLGEKVKALNYYNQALLLARKVGNRSREAFTLYGIAVVERDRGNLNKGLTQIEAALKILESVRNQISRQELRTSYFAKVQDYYKFYIDLLMQLHKSNPSIGYDAKALQASEHARARSLLEILNSGRVDIRQGADPKLLEQELSIKQQLSIKQERQVKLLSGEHTSAQEADIQKETETLLNQYQEIQAQIRVKSPHYAALTQPVPLTLSEIQSTLLDDKTLLLEYSLGEDRSYLWAVTKTGISSYELPKRASIEVAARQFRDALTATRLRTNPAKVAAAANALSQLVLKPVAGQLSQKRLLIVSDGALQYIPFAALTTPVKSARGEQLVPLVVEHEIINLPSASTLGVLRRDLASRQPATKTIAIFADPIFSLNDVRVNGITSLPAAPFPTSSDVSLQAQRLERSATESGIQLRRLTATREEAEAIIKLVPAGDRVQAFDFDASLARATNPNLAQYRILHFATHGILNSINPELSGIVLSLVNKQGKLENGFLRLHDIYNLNLSADLVVLSACKTGLGQEIKGEGLVGLTRGFMYAGAKRVVVSLWSVDDKATAELMSRFYQGMLEKKLAPAAALRAAQVEMWQVEQWKSPYYWAAFVIQGEWK